MACFLVNAPRRLSKKGNGSLAQKCTYPHMQTDQMPQKGKTILHEECDLQLGSPAKINLFLRIMEKRPDGTLHWTISYVHGQYEYNHEKLRSSLASGLVHEVVLILLEIVYYFYELYDERLYFSFRKVFIILHLYSSLSACVTRYTFT